MPSQKTSRITFDQAGNIKIDHAGFVGKACETATEKLMAGLGASRSKTELKPEAHQQQTGQQAHQAASKW